MNANELRIGNLFRWKSTNEVEVVHDILTYGRKPTINNVNIQDAEPIPLTEEWLLRFGFLKTHKKAEWTIGAFRVCKTFDVDFVYPDWDINYIALPYVHQLQNLHFALTGQELTIKEAAR